MLMNEINELGVFGEIPGAGATLVVKSIGYGTDCCTVQQSLAQARDSEQPALLGYPKTRLRRWDPRRGIWNPAARRCGR
jgi:hypothetical protein